VGKCGNAYWVERSESLPPADATVVGRSMGIADDSTICLLAWEQAVRSRSLHL